MPGLVLGLTVAVLMAPGADAQDRHGRIRDTRPSYDTCVDASRAVTASMLDCIDTEYTYQDALLNAAYRKAMAQLMPRQRMVLRDSQRKWLRDREPECLKGTEAFEGCSWQIVLTSSCMLDALIARTDWLNHYRP